MINSINIGQNPHKNFGFIRNLDGRRSQSKIRKSKRDDISKEDILKSKPMKDVVSGFSIELETQKMEYLDPILFRSCCNAV